MDNQNQRIHNCVLCNAKLNSKEALQEHFRKHANKEIDNHGKPSKMNRKPVTKCDICGESFDTVTATIRHRYKIHPNSPTKFYCPYCGMQFALKVHRDNHQITHDPLDSEKKEQHLNCDECNVLFYNTTAHDYHYRSMHKRMIALFKPIATPPPSNKIKVNSMNDAMSVYYCHLCGTEYIVKFNLQQHLERTHSQEEREAVPENLIKCNVCAALFYNKKAYDVHNGYHQPNDLYVTSEKQRLQTITKVDQDFDIRRVQAIAEKYIPKTCASNSFQTSIKVQIGRSKREKSNNDSSDSESDLPLEKRIAS